MLVSISWVALTPKQMALQVALRRRGCKHLARKGRQCAFNMFRELVSDPHAAGTGPNPAQLKPQMAALVLALAQAAKANAAAQAQRNQQACWQLCRVFNGSPHWRKPSKPRKQHQRQPHRRSNDAIAEADYRPLVKIQRQLTLRRGVRRARLGAL